MNFNRIKYAILFLSCLIPLSTKTGNHHRMFITIDSPFHLFYGLIGSFIGARLLLHGISLALQSEEDIAQDLITDLEEKIEKRRSENDDELDVLRQQLNALRAGPGNNETTQVISLQKQLEKLEEKARLISLDYQTEYVQISPRVRSNKEQASSRIIKGTLCMLVGFWCFSAKR